MIIVVIPAYKPGEGLLQVCLLYTSSSTTMPDLGGGRKIPFHGEKQLLRCEKSRKGRPTLERREDKVSHPRERKYPVSYTHLASQASNFSLIF